MPLLDDVEDLLFFDFFMLPELETMELPSVPLDVVLDEVALPEDLPAALLAPEDDIPLDDGAEEAPAFWAKAGTDKTRLAAMAALVKMVFMAMLPVW